MYREVAQRLAQIWASAPARITGTYRRRCAGSKFGPVASQPHDLCIPDRMIQSPASLSSSSRHFPRSPHACSSPSRGLPLEALCPPLAGAVVSLLGPLAGWMIATKINCQKRMVPALLQAVPAKSRTGSSKTHKCERKIKTHLAAAALGEIWLQQKYHWVPAN